MEIGQKFRVSPAFVKGERNDRPRQTGKVVWIHPKGRFAVLEFKGVHGKPRECFSISDLVKN